MMFSNQCNRTFLVRSRAFSSKKILPQIQTETLELLCDSFLLVQVFSLFQVFVLVLVCSTVALQVFAVCSDRSKGKVLLSLRPA